ERQQQAAANHIAQRAVGLFPLPGFAQLLRQPAAARPWMGRDQFPDIDDIFTSDYPAPVLEFRHNRSMNGFFMERKGMGMFFIGVGPLAATWERPAHGTHRRRPSATAPHTPPAVWPGCPIPATIRISLWTSAFAPASSPGRHR